MTITPGPYRVNPVNGRSIETLDGKRIAHNFYARKAGSSQDIPPEEVFGNAHLLAASWDMRQALEDSDSLLADLSQWLGSEQIDLIVDQRRRNAEILDKAEGEEPTT